MSKQEPSVVYVFRGSSGTIPWSEIRRVIGTQFERHSALALTVTCSVAGTTSSAPNGISVADTGFSKADKRSTMADVAREANVSTSTVSRVLNDYWSIGSDTQRRVEAAMRRLDYRPNEAARTMVRNRRKRGGQDGECLASEPGARSSARDAMNEESRAASK